MNQSNRGFTLGGVQSIGIRFWKILQHYGNSLNYRSQDIHPFVPAFREELVCNYVIFTFFECDYQLMVFLMFSE